MHKLAFCVCLVVLCGSVSGFLWDKEVEIVSSQWSPIVVVVRHVEYIGTTDNGTLDCSVPGFTKYRWTVINKASKDGFTESYIMGTGDEKIPDSQSHMKIGYGGFRVVNDLLVVSCEAMLGLNPRMQIIWAITRLHSPMGYPTDPRVCDFGAASVESSCLWYQWTYKQDCYYDRGVQYTGSVNYANHGKKCKYWHMATGPHRESQQIARLMGIFDKGGHDYCRNIPWNPKCYLTKGEDESCKDNQLTQPWCFSDDDPKEAKFALHFCNVPECSSCMYGNGDGSFSLYPGKKFPPYLGRGITTTKKEKDGGDVFCLQTKGWKDNVCRAKISIKTPSMDTPHVVTKATPHCYVPKPGVKESKVKKVSDDELDLVPCKFRQCTIRQVWFLFFNTYGKPFVVESNFKGVKIELVRGRAEELIKFGAFGIHLTNGLTIGTHDYSAARHLDSFSLIPRRPPDRLSVLKIRNVKKHYSGLYFLQYDYAEADPTVDVSTYKVNFQLDVKEPTSFFLRPSVLRVCLKGDGKMNLNVKGYFTVLEDSIRWKYGSSRTSIKKEILPQNTRFELSADAKGLTVKTVTEELWVSVEGRSYSGTPSAVARVGLKDQALLKAVSPVTQYALPGDDVTLIIESDQLQKVTWMFDAMVISSLPDDPNMGFQRMPRGGKLVTSLVISDVRDHHYGKYFVAATLDGCEKVVTFDVRHASEKPDNENLQVDSSSVVKSTAVFNRTGLWCTDELDPYAFFFDVDLRFVMTIGALQNEPLTASSAVEVQHYSIKYSMDSTTWTRFTLKGNNTRIPYTFLSNAIHWLPVPLIARFIRFYPEKMDATACMKVRLFGCKGVSLDCNEVKNLEKQVDLRLAIGVPAVVVSMVTCVTLYLWKRQQTGDETKTGGGGKDKKLSRKKESKEKRKREREKRKKKEREGKKKKQKRDKYRTSSEESSETDSEDERETRRKKRRYARKKENEKKRKRAKRREKDEKSKERESREKRKDKSKNKERTRKEKEIDTESDNERERKRRLKKDEKRKDEKRKDEKRKKKKRREEKSSDDSESPRATRRHKRRSRRYSTSYSDSSSSSRTRRKRNRKRHSSEDGSD